MVRARWRWRGSRCVARVRSSALFLAAHKHKPARCCVVCCVFWFLGPPRALFCSISQHTGQVLRLPLGHPAGTVLRFLVFRPGLGSVSPNIAAHRRGSCFMLVDAHLSAPHPHPLTCCRCLILSLPAALADLCAAFSGFWARPEPCFTQYRSTQAGFRVCP